jgi:hypothetical protein
VELYCAGYKREHFPVLLLYESLRGHSSHVRNVAGGGAVRLCAGNDGRPFAAWLFAFLVEGVFSRSRDRISESTQKLKFCPQEAARELLFPISPTRVWQVFREYATAAGLPPHKCHPHVLKHTVASGPQCAGINFSGGLAFLPFTRSLEGAYFYRVGTD